jgi:hypothetical protein
MSREKTGTNGSTRMQLASLPLEVLLLISEFLDLENLRAMTMTCSYMNTTLDPMLYKYAVVTGVYKGRLLEAAIKGRAAVVSKFLKAGVLMTEFKDETSLPDLYWTSRDASRASRCHPLLAAAVLGHVGVIRVLIEEGNVDIDFGI